MQFLVQWLPKAWDKLASKAVSEKLAKREVALNRTAMLGTNIILDRTSKGEGYGGRFSAYSPEYAKRKSEGWEGSGRVRGFGGDASGVVNLKVRGEMLSSIVHKANKNEAEIFFSRAAEAKKAAMNNELRPFFGFNKAEKERLVKYFMRQMQ